MARFVPTANRLLAVLLTENTSLAISRRGYAAAVTVERIVVNNENKLIEGSLDSSSSSSSSSSSWVPDPSTGYYKPAGQAVEVDPVDLRNMFLSKK